MATGQNDNFGLGSETPSRFVVGSSTPGLWSLGLKTGLTPQQLAPLNTGTHHKLEVNPFEASYAHVGGDRRFSAGEPAFEHLKRPRIDELQHAGAGPQKDSSSSNSSNESRATSTTMAYDTPPSDATPLSPVAIKSMAGTPVHAISHVMAPQNGAIDASAYAEHLARYVQAQAVHATRTSAPLAGHSTSRPQASLNNSSPEQHVVHHFSDDAMSAVSPEQADGFAHDDANLPPAISSVQPVPAQAPRKKTAATPKTTPAQKQRKGPGRPKAPKEEEPEEMTAEESKRRDFLERNRQAACKSRQKRKAWQANLEAEANRLTDSNGQLQALVATLREEIASLRATVAGHAANGCQAARLALQAARPGDVPMAAFVLPSPNVAMHSPVMGHPGSDIYVGHSAMDSAIAYHHPSAIEAQRSRSGPGPLPELTPSYGMGAGANYFDVAAAAGLSNQHLVGRSSDVDLSAYLA